MESQGGARIAHGKRRDNVGVKEYCIKNLDKSVNVKEELTSGYVIMMMLVIMVMKSMMSYCDITGGAEEVVMEIVDKMTSLFSLDVLYLQCNK